MKTVFIVLGVLAAIAVALVLFLTGQYNGLVNRSQAVDAQWAQVQNVYQRRADLVPNLVATVSGAANFEKSTLTEITTARASVGKVQINPNAAPTDPAQLAEFDRAQGQLTSALSRLLVVAENYPTLKATANFQELQAQLEGTENRISVERGRFNELARDYNAAIKRAPAVFFAGIMGFKEKAYFTAAAGSDKAPQVQFDFGQQTPGEALILPVKEMIRHLLLAFVLCGGLSLAASERIPAAPARYFNDYAGVVSPAVVEELNAKLEQFERTSSNQLLVAIYPKMESDSSVSDYTVRVAESWRVGQKSKNNGAVLFAFMQEHHLYLQVGYGLEAVLPDATAKRIIETEIVPRFRQQDVDGGMKAAVSAMIAATKGEYTGSGHTRNDRQTQGSARNINLLVVVAFIIISIAISRRRSRRMYVFGGRRGGWWMGPPPGGGGGWSSGGGGGGGFSGGGGSFGGGGAGGKW